MDKAVKEHQTSTSFKYCVYQGNNSALIRKLLEQSYSNTEEVDMQHDEKYANQIANLIWRQNDLTTYTNGIWENTNSKLRYNGFWINKVNKDALAKEDPAVVAQIKPVLRIVNHIDSFKSITTKTGIIGSLRNYYGHLKDKILELDGTVNPHHIPFFHHSGSTAIKKDQTALVNHSDYMTQGGTIGGAHHSRDHSCGQLITSSAVNQMYRTNN